jgi:hypothetical protein
LIRADILNIASAAPSHLQASNAFLEHAVGGAGTGILLGMMMQLVLLDRGALSGDAMTGVHLFPVQDHRAGDVLRRVP